MAFIFAFDKKTNSKMLLVNIPLLFIVLPVVSSLLNVFIFNDLGSYIPHKGFSAVVAGVFGYLAFSTLHYIKTNYDVKYEKGIFQLMWLILYINLAILSFIYGYFPIVILLLFLILLSIYTTRKDIKKIAELLRKLKRPARVTVFTSLYLCCFVGVIGLFPGNLHNNGNLVNILAHFFGYVFGFLVPALVSIYIFDKRNI